MNLPKVTHGFVTELGFRRSQAGARACTLNWASDMTRALQVLSWRSDPEHSYVTARRGHT